MFICAWYPLSHQWYQSKEKIQLSKTYQGISADAFDQSLRESNLFQNDQTFSFLSLVQGNFDVLFSEQEAIVTY